jgi:3',5'-cyclic AMP phosphodiesterase CpdA
VRIAHISDLHLLSLEGAVPFRLLNKRFTGYLSLRFKRHAIHKPFAARAVAHEIRRLDIDHVVITGDVSNLALEREFETVGNFLRDDISLPRDRISMVPGNHDAYTHGAHRSSRFSRYFEPFLRSDLPELAEPGRVGLFPYVHLRGPAAIIGISTATPRLPMVSSGVIGQPQLRALGRLLAHPDVRSRTPVLLQHHPFHNPESYAKMLMEGLTDAAAEGRVLRGVARGLLLHGHLHRRIHRTLRTDVGHIDAIGATSASLVHASEERMAGFNLYEIGDDGAIGAITAHRLDPETKAFHEVPIPRG